MSAYYATDFFLPPQHTQQPPPIHARQHAPTHAINTQIHAQPNGIQQHQSVHGHALNGGASHQTRHAPNSLFYNHNSTASTYYAGNGGNLPTYPPYSTHPVDHSLTSGLHFYQPRAEAWPGVGDGPHFDVNYVNAAATFDYADLSSGGLKSWHTDASNSTAQPAQHPATVAALLNSNANEMLLLNCSAPGPTFTTLHPPTSSASMFTSNAIVAAAMNTISTSVPPVEGRAAGRQSRGLKAGARKPGARSGHGGHRPVVPLHLQRPHGHPPVGRAIGSNVPPKSFTCSQCERQYCRKSTLKAHQKQHQNSDRQQFSCPACGKTFTQAANLTAHRRVHTGEKPFACSICLRPFSQSSSLVTHRRTHTGERPYPCEHCSKSFTDSSTLTKHLRTHTGQKPYNCHLCLMRFSQSGNLHRHMKTHRPLGGSNTSMESGLE